MLSCIILSFSSLIEYFVSLLSPFALSVQVYSIEFVVILVAEKLEGCNGASGFVFFSRVIWITFESEVPSFAFAYMFMFPSGWASRLMLNEYVPLFIGDALGFSKFVYVVLSSE